MPWACNTEKPQPHPSPPLQTADASSGKRFDWEAAASFLAALGPPGITVEPVVRAMRHQRHPWMVEGAEQYAFVYSVVLEELAVRALESAP